jgi:hypothetical protein
MLAIDERLDKLRRQLDQKTTEIESGCSSRTGKGQHREQANSRSDHDLFCSRRSASFLPECLARGSCFSPTEAHAALDDRDVIAVYRDCSLGGYCNCTVIMVGGEEISGCALVAAIDRI